MNNIQAGGSVTAGGDIIVGNNNTSGSKLWVDCSSDELRGDFYYRKKLLRDETFSKWKRIVVAWLAVGAVAAAVAIYFYVVGNTNLSGLIMGGAGIFMGFATIKVTEQPNEFELRQMNALNGIKTILKERGERV